MFKSIYEKVKIDIDNALFKAWKRIKELELKTKILKECVEFYSVHANHLDDSEVIYSQYGMGKIQGKRAREVLRKLKEREE